MGFGSASGLGVDAFLGLGSGMGFGFGARVCDRVRHRIPLRVLVLGFGLGSDLNRISDFVGACHGGLVIKYVIPSRFIALPSSNSVFHECRQIVCSMTRSQPSKFG